MDYVSIKRALYENHYNDMENILDLKNRLESEIGCNIYNFEKTPDGIRILIHTSDEAPDDFLYNFNFVLKEFISSLTGIDLTNIPAQSMSEMYKFFSLGPGHATIIL